MRRYTTTSEAYLESIKYVLDNYDFDTSPRDMDTLEVINWGFSITWPDSNSVVTKDEKRNEVIADYTVKELAWYKEGLREADSAPSKFWKTIADKDGLINSNYGHLINKDKSECGMTPFWFAMFKLFNDRDTRQAILRINKPQHSMPGNKDFPCTIYLNAHIRQDRLHLTVRMRSSDLFTGMPYDLPYFAQVQEQLIEVYNMCSEEDQQIEKGMLHFSADSCHIYKKDITKLKKIIGEEV